MMSPAPEGIAKVREARLRRMARRQGFVLHRSARRDELALDYNKYWVEEEAGAVVYGGPGRDGVTIDAVERWLSHPEEREGQ